MGEEAEELLEDAICWVECGVRSFATRPKRAARLGRPGTRRRKTQMDARGRVAKEGVEDKVTGVEEVGSWRAGWAGWRLQERASSMNSTGRARGRTDCTGRKTAEFASIEQHAYNPACRNPAAVGRDEAQHRGEVSKEGNALRY